MLVQLHAALASVRGSQLLMAGDAAAAACVLCHQLISILSKYAGPSLANPDGAWADHLSRCSMPTEIDGNNPACSQLHAALLLARGAQVRPDEAAAALALAKQLLALLSQRGEKRDEPSTCPASSLASQDAAEVQKPCICSLPMDTLARIFTCLPSARDLVNLSAVSRVFHNPPHSAIDLALFQRASKGNHPVPETPRDGALSWTHMMCKAELVREANLARRLSAGEIYSLSIDAQGRLLSCGSDEDNELESVGPRMVFGLLGQGLTEEDESPFVERPTLVRSMLGMRVCSVAASDYHALAITEDGAVWSWGSGHYGALGHANMRNCNRPEKIEALCFQRRHACVVAVQKFYSLAVTTDGAAWSWGYDYGLNGTLGHGNNSPRTEKEPKQIMAFVDHHVCALAAGHSHGLAVTADGSAWSWGSEEGITAGVLGHGEGHSAQPQPKRIEAFAGRCVCAVSAADHHNLAITADGAAWSWGCEVEVGEYRSGALGHGKRVKDGVQRQPMQIEVLAGQRICAVSASDIHSLAVTAKGTVWSWGRGASGHQRLRKLIESDELYVEPKQIKALAGHDICDVFAAAEHCLALSANGTVWSWGDGRHCALGHGDRRDCLRPKRIKVPIQSE